MKRIGNVVRVCLLLAASGLFCGCAAFRTSVKPVDVDTARPMDANYDYSDLRILGSSVSQDLLADKLLRDAASAPIFVVMGVQNRTERHIDTKALTDTIRTHMIDSGKALFVNETQRDNLLKEQGYQLANCKPEAQTAIGKQLGAKYMLTGSLVEIKKESGREVRVSKKEEVYYQLTVEVTDLETGLIVWTKQKERARSASKPLIGW